MSDTAGVREQAPPRSMVPFLLVWQGQTFSLLGSQLVQFALVWWLTKTTGSATVLAFATMMALLPPIILGPFAGALVDRWNRRTVMILADGGIALATVVLAVLYALGVVQVWHIYVLMFIRALGAAFHWPAMQGSTTLMVPGKHLSRVAGLNQTVYGFANVAAPPLGALLLEVVPMQGILAIDVGTALLAIAPLAFIRIPQPERMQTGLATGGQPTVLADFREGLRLVWGWPGMMIIIGIAMLLNLLVTPALSLLPIMVTKHFGGGAVEFAWLESAWGVGVVLGGLILGAWGGFKRRVVTGMLGLALQGLGILVLGVTPADAFFLSVGAIFFAGLMNPIVNGSLFATVQVTVSPEMQGRIFTLLHSGAMAMTPLGLAIAGPVADRLSVQLWFMIGGMATSAIGLGAFFVPAVMGIEDRAPDAIDQDG